MSNVMVTPRLSSFLQRLAGLTDGQLLDQFARSGDEGAFAALVERHGPMVLGVCRRVLGDDHDADDAFQATFLVLARKARSLDQEKALGNWLYTVAHNSALKVKRGARRRRAHERQVQPMSVQGSQGETDVRELRRVLDAELSRLPEKYRAPLVLCYLQGKTNEAAARELGWPSGSMARRLEKGRELLCQRLTSRGLALSTAAVASLVASNATAAVPAALVQVTSRSAKLFAAGTALIGDGPCRAAEVAEAVLRTGAFSGFKGMAAVVLAVGLLAGGGALGYQHFTASSAVPTTDPIETVTKAPPPEPVLSAADRDVLAKLDRRLELPEGLAPNTALSDALEFLADRSGLTFAIDSEAFASFGIAHAAEQSAQLSKLPALRTSTVLRLLLTQYRGEESQGCYEVKDGKVVVTMKKTPIEVKRAPASAALLKKLEEAVTLEAGIAENTPLAEAFQLLSEKSGVAFFVNETEWHKAGLPAAGGHPVQLPAQDKVKLRVVLEKLLATIKLEDGQVGGYILTEDLVEIIPTKAPQKK